MAFLFVFLSHFRVRHSRRCTSYVRIVYIQNSRLKHFGDDARRPSRIRRRIQPTNEKQSTARNVSCPSHIEHDVPRSYMGERVCVCVFWERQKQTFDGNTIFSALQLFRPQRAKSTWTNRWWCRRRRQRRESEFRPTMAWINMCGWWKWTCFHNNSDHRPLAIG